MFKSIVTTLFLIMAGTVNAQVNKFAESADLGYVLDEGSLASASGSPVACNQDAPMSGAFALTALYCENASMSDLRLGIEWKRTSMKIEPFAQHLGGTLLKEIGSAGTGNIRWDVVKAFVPAAGVKGTLFDCVVTDGGKKYFLSFFLFSTKEDGKRQIIYLFSKTPDSSESEASVRSAVRNIAATVQPSAK